MNVNDFRSKSQWLSQARDSLRDYCDAKNRFEAAQAELQTEAARLSALLLAWEWAEPCAIPIEHPTKGTSNNYALITRAPGCTSGHPQFTIRHTADMIPYPCDDND